MIQHACRVCKQNGNNRAALIRHYLFRTQTPIELKRIRAHIAIHTNRCHAYAVPSFDSLQTYIHHLYRHEKKGKVECAIRVREHNVWLDFQSITINLNRVLKECICAHSMLHRLFFSLSPSFTMLTVIISCLYRCWVDRRCGEDEDPHKTDNEIKLWMYLFSRERECAESWTHMVIFVSYNRGISSFGHCRVSFTWEIFRLCAVGERKLRELKRDFVSYIACIVRSIRVSLNTWNY